MLRKPGLLSVLLIVGLCAGASAELISYHPFNEGSGTTAADATGNGNDGTFVNAVEWVPGVKGMAIRLDTDSERVAIGPIDPTAANNAMTLAAWIKWENPPGQDQQGIFGKRIWTPRDLTKWFWEAREDGRLAFRNGDLTLSAPAGTLTPYVNEWIHVAVTWDDGAMIQYINAQEVHSGNVTLRTTADATPVTIGTTEGGETFHGTIDEARIYDTALTPAQIAQAMTGDTSSASGPQPAKEATDVPRDVVLSWTPGEFAPAVNGHTVYLSDNFNNVNDGIGGTTVSAASYAPPQRLDFETIYYWRVDEVNAPPDSTVSPGEVWSFTTEPVGYAIENITATASSVAPGDFGPEHTIDGSGLNANDGHSTKPVDMWLSDTLGPQPAWIEYQFDKVYSLYEMWVWNSNQAFESFLGYGPRAVTVEYSSDGVEWAILADAPEFAQAPSPATDDYAHNTTVDFGGVPAKHVRLTVNSNWGSVLPQSSLSEVRFFSIPMGAREPSPDSGATGVDLDPVLGWRAGRKAATHNLYLSEDGSAVADGTAPVTSLTVASHGPVALDLGKRYFWRVDEVNDVETPAVTQGDIWNFGTIQSLVVDDFESYNDIDPPDANSNRIFEGWPDGFGVAANGALVGNDPANPSYAETVIVHGGVQSMPLFYSNTLGVTFSEVSTTLSGQRDWTAKGIDQLSLWFKGNSAGLVEDPAGTYTITAAGVDIWGTADEFRYVWKQVSGDCEITAMVESLLWVPGSGDWSKAGVMVRGTLDAGSANAFIALTSGSGDGASFQWRPSAGGASSSSRTLTGISPPTYVKLVRQGNTFTGYVFLDGQWQQEGTSATVTMPDPVYIGLALTSHSSGVTTEAVFSEVAIIGAATGQFTEQVIGAAAMPSNDPVPLYVAVANSGGSPAVVTHDNAAASQIGAWTQWRIDVQEFAAKGVNLANVDKMFIGLGDKANPQLGGSGTMYFDDIELYPQSAPLPDTIAP